MHVTGLHDLTQKKITRLDDFFVTRIYHKKNYTNYNIHFVTLDSLPKKAHTLSPSPVGFQSICSQFLVHLQCNLQSSSSPHSLRLHSSSSAPPVLFILQEVFRFRGEDDNALIAGSVLSSRVW